MEKMVNLTTEETKDLTKWWGDASIVGEYESKLVLALIHEKELPWFHTIDLRTEDI